MTVWLLSVKRETHVQSININENIYLEKDKGRFCC